MESISFNNKQFKKYDDHYYISADGDVYSTYINRCLKPGIDTDGYLRVDIHGRHMKIHKLVYLTWIGPVEESLQINHKDDNKYNNHWSNLYTGTQKENIHDCVKNNHRIGHSYYLIVVDKETKKTLVFFPASNFGVFSGHQLSNGSPFRMTTRNWFKEKISLCRLWAN